MQLTSQPHLRTSIRHVGLPKTQLYALRDMVICVVVGCSRNSKRAKGVSFFRLHTVVRHQGEKAIELSEKRRALWLSPIRRADLGPEKFAVAISSRASTSKF